MWWLTGKISVASGIMRTVSLFRALLLVCLSACASAGGGSPVPIRVMVYNIHAGKDAGRADNLRRVADVIRESHADIVLLQEVDRRTRRSWGVDQLARLRDLTGFRGRFGKTIDYDGGEYGIAILSRWPIEKSELARLPVLPGDSLERSAYEERGALVAHIRTGSGAIRVVNTHLDATRSDSNRIQQVRALIGIANAERDSAFTLVGGDLNSGPGSAVLSLLGDAGWEDLFARCGRGQPFSFPADSPSRRIDYLLAGGDAQCSSARVLDTRASDHRPVLFEIEIKRGN